MEFTLFGPILPCLSFFLLRCFLLAADFRFARSRRVSVVFIGRTTLERVALPKLWLVASYRSQESGSELPAPHIWLVISVELR